MLSNATAGKFRWSIAILALAAVLAVVAPGFFTPANQRDLLLANMPVLIVALGMTLVILTGQIDISVGSQFAICSVAAGVFAKMGLPTPLAGAGGLSASGALMGAHQRRAGGVGADPVDRGDAGDHGGAARRPALGDAGRVGAGPAAGLPVVRAIAGGERGDYDRRCALRCWRADGLGAAQSGGGPRGVRHRDRTRTRRGWRASIRRAWCSAVFVLTGALTGLRRGVQRRALQPDSEQRRESGWK